MASSEIKVLRGLVIIISIENCSILLCKEITLAELSCQIYEIYDDCPEWQLSRMAPNGITETGLEMVYPNRIKGLSFADSVETLSKKELEGEVWIIPRGTKIPGDLVFNIKDIDHPLLNVSKPMTVLEMTVLLTELASLMEDCKIKIGKYGKIIEKSPGALLKAAKL